MEWRHWALCTMESIPESWRVLTAPWLGQGGSSMGAKSCAGVAEAVSCSSQVAEAQIQVPSAAHPVLIRGRPAVLSEPEEEEAQVPSAPHWWWARQLETAHLHPASLPSYLAKQLQGTLGGPRFTMRILLYPSKPPHCPCLSWCVCRPLAVVPWLWLILRCKHHWQ